MPTIGKHSMVFESKPMIISSASYVGEKEGSGPLGEKFDVVFKDDTLGLDSWEQAESRMFESAVRVALHKIDKSADDLSCVIGGDLLNQIISSGFAARELRAPFIGLYSACSTITEALIIGGIMSDGGFSELCACAGSSHFSSVERQYRYPLEMGVQSVPTAQRTVTGAGSVLLSANGKKENAAHFRHVALTEATLGRVEDFGITDTGNMGAAMAPAAANTIKTHLNDLNRTVKDYDRIITGDLGKFGSEMLYELCKKDGIDLKFIHDDCGKLIFSEDQNVVCGGSGCGCASVVLSSEILPKIEAGEYRRILFLATGALMSPVSALQGESIPAISHAVVIEHI